jgi:hypothetical protein
MGSSEWKFVAGGALAAALFVGFHFMVPGPNAAALKHDHTKKWSYVKVPHRAANVLERRLGEVASLVAGRPVQVRCEDFSDGEIVEPGGVVQFNGSKPADWARLRPDVCSHLVHFMQTPAGAEACLAVRRCDERTETSAEALKILAHESYHLRGVKNEAVAECYAMQAVPRVARALAGATFADAHALAVIVYLVGYPGMPPAYRSGQCRPGGALDLSSGSNWP